MDLRDDREGPFAADDKLREIVAGDVLQYACAGGEDLTVREHRFDAEHIVFGDAVLHCMRSAGALGKVPADEAAPARCRVGRVGESGRLDLFLEFLRDHAGFDRGLQVLPVDLDDAVEPLHGEDRCRPAPAASRRRVPCRPRAE